MKRIEKQDELVTSLSTEVLHQLSALARHMEAKIVRLDAALGKCEISYKIDREAFSAMRYLHGGIVCALLDDCASVACASRVGIENFGVTSSLNVDFVSPSNDEEVMCLGAVISAKLDTVIVRVEAKSPSVETIAFCTAKFRVRRRSKI